MNQDEANNQDGANIALSTTPSPLASPPLSVELNLQDYFFAALPVDSLLEAEAVAEAEDNKVSEVSQIAPLESDLEADRPTAPILPAMWETWFQHWLQQLQTELPPSEVYELSLRLTDDAEIQALNAQYRHKNQPTDVLAFAALEVDYPQFDEIAEGLPLYLGDIVISVETAQKQAVQFGHSLQQELAWLAAHALLHLLGWDHPDDDSLNCMLKQQAFLLQTVGLSIDYYQVEKSTEQEYSDTEPCKV